MPPVTKVTREEILDAVMNIIDKSGWPAVTARAVAKTLHISTQPIYREFKDMNELKQAALDRGWREYVEFIRKGSKAGNQALAQSTAYVRFAAAHSHLFRLLFMSKSIEYGSIDEMAHSIIEDSGIIDLLMEVTGLEREAVYQLHFYIWMTMHGLASIASANRVNWSDEELEQVTLTLSRALTLYFKENEI